LKTSFKKGNIKIILSTVRAKYLTTNDLLFYFFSDQSMSILEYTLTGLFLFM